MSTSIRVSAILYPTELIRKDQLVVDRAVLHYYQRLYEDCSF
jgi:hypothetical protein